MIEFRFGMISACMSLMMASVGADTMTCQDIKDHYKKEECCGNPDQMLSTVPGAGSCPYNFDKPLCAKAEVQAPRDLSDGAKGDKRPKAATLNVDQTNALPLTNVHFHYGAEHKSNSYSDGTLAEQYDAKHSDHRRLGARRLAGDVRPGFMCSNEGLSEDDLKPYEFQHCKGQVYVGKSYEVHYVHSSAGYTSEQKTDLGVDGIDDGLGGAANGRGLLNPMITVQGQVFHIVQGAADVQDMLHGWTVVGHDNSVMYPGSTTGPSHTNEVCSPYSITWHVDKDCHHVSPESFDRLCEQMMTQYGLEGDTYPHGSRILVDRKWVAQDEYVVPLA